MGAQESKRWVEMPPETPELQQKRIGKLKQLQDPRSPGIAPRTPIQLQEYDESPHNRELKIDIADPRSPAPLIERTPIMVEARRNSKLTRNPSTHTETAVEIVELPQEEERKIPQELPETMSPATAVCKKDQAKLLKKTVSPGDFKRQRRASRRQSVPVQKLFTDRVAPIPRSPLTQRNSIDLGETGLKKNKTLNKKHGPHYTELGSGKENPSVNAVC